MSYPLEPNDYTRWWLSWYPPSPIKFLVVASVTYHVSPRKIMLSIMASISLPDPSPICIIFITLSAYFSSWEKSYFKRCRQIIWKEQKEFFQFWRKLVFFSNLVRGIWDSYFLRKGWPEAGKNNQEIQGNREKQIREREGEGEKQMRKMESKFEKIRDSRKNLDTYVPPRL